MLISRRRPSSRNLTLTRACLLIGSVSLGALGACSASNGDTSSDGGGELPSAVDNDNDGVVDSLGVTLDADGDGVADLFDFHGDGSVVGIGVDTNGDGIADAIGIDTNGDNILDALDTNGDGEADQFATVPAAGGDGDGDGDLCLTCGGDGDTPVDKPVGNFCDEFEVVFEPKTPTVYVVVDRSTSMFDSNFWEQLKGGLLPIVQDLQSDVRFGFASYTGEKNNEASCGLGEAVPIAENNYDAVAAGWNALGEPAGKGETPTSYAILQAKDALILDKSPGSRFILLVSDGSPDMCHDDYNICGVDGTIAALQVAASEGVRTLVFGIEAASVTQAEFDKFAQAGIGEAPVAPTFEGNVLDTYDQFSGTMANRCADKGIWADLRTKNDASRTAAGMTESDFEPAGAYSSTEGTASAFLSSDLGALADQIRSSLAGLKSCQIALNFGVSNAAAGQIFVDDKNVPIPDSDWKLVDETDDVIELSGASCDLWQSDAVNYFFAGFPCDAVVVR